MAVRFLRSALIYLLLIMIIRMMGKRQLGEMEPSEFVVSLLIADLAAAPMQDTEMPLGSSLIPIIVVFALELLFSTLSYHYIFVRKLFCGKPVILMENGKILQENLRRTRVTPDELTEHLREKGVIDLSNVKYAILETNGQISVLRDSLYEPVTPQDLGLPARPISLPYTIICNGRLISDNLRLSGKTSKWLSHQLAAHQCSIREVLLLTVDEKNSVYLAKYDQSIK